MAGGSLKRAALLLLILLSANTSQYQSLARAQRARATRQTVKGSTATAKMFAEGIISTGDVYGTAFTPDMKTVYFAKSDDTRTDVKIMVSHLKRGGWTEPQVAPFSSVDRFVGNPYITQDGERMFFMGNKPMNIWVMDRTDAGWGPPVKLAPPVNTEQHHEYYPSVSRSGNLYFSTERGKGGGDIYVSKMVNGKLTEPENIEELNTEGAESNPWVASDESYLLFLSNRAGSYGDWDLWISYREGDKWGQPINLGPKVNTKDREFCPVISPDGKYLFFSRTQFKDGRRTIPENIYYIPLAALPIRRVAR